MLTFCAIYYPWWLTNIYLHLINDVLNQFSDLKSGFVKLIWKNVFCGEIRQQCWNAIKIITGRHDRNNRKSNVFELVFSKVSFIKQFGATYLVEYLLTKYFTRNGSIERPKHLDKLVDLSVQGCVEFQCWGMQYLFVTKQNIRKYQGFPLLIPHLHKSFSCFRCSTMRWIYLVVGFIIWISPFSPNIFWSSPWPKVWVRRRRAVG